ncbi:MAG TPA: hypothetical protein VEI47_07900 [Gemmatimonadales bacterium]|nr:hypothetical protein [Gemmatimonadales bacterium]
MTLGGRRGDFRLLRSLLRPGLAAAALWDEGLLRALAHDLLRVGPARFRAAALTV